MGKRTLTLAILLISALAQAAVPIRQANGEKQNRYIEAGVFVGGHDHGPLSLIDVRHSLQANMERLVFDVGQNVNDDSVERPGFFHIAIQDRPNRIVVDLENITKVKINAQQIASLFKKSPFFSKVSIYEDPFHQSLTLEFPLKVRAEMEVFELVTPGKPGRIVMDIRKL
jgi:hypothetical protein